jgi:hypothetical protein
MARIKRKYKSLDCRIKDKEDRRAEHISGYEWAIRIVSDEYDIIPNHIAVLVAMYDYEFYSGHTIEKRMPLGNKYIFKLLDKLIKDRWVLKAFDETEVTVSKRIGSAQDVHIHAESRMIRDRYRHSQKANDMCERFIELSDEFGKKLIPYDQVRGGTDISRNATGTIRGERTGSKDYVVSPFSDDHTTYYEEEVNVDQWYEQVKNWKG